MLESILLKAYELGMDDAQRIQMLERALVFVAGSLAFDDKLTFREIVEKQEEIIRFAKIQAMEDMQIMPPIDKSQAEI